jgi:hypothetical protein
VGNYTITYNTGTLTVTKATLTVTANNKIMGYSQAVPALTYTLSGFANGENTSVVSGAPNLSTTASSSSLVGTYPITPAQGTLSAANYTFTMQNGTMTVISTIKVAATDATASEIGPDSGTYRFTRLGGDVSTALTVNYTISGATDTTDYQHLTGSVIIPLNATFADMTLTPALNANPGVGSKTVILTLGASGNNSYAVDTLNYNATVTIIDAYGDTDGDGLADAMEAAFGCNPLTVNTDWKLDSDNDGLPDTYEIMVGLSKTTAEAAPVLPAYSPCPL